MEKQQAIAEPGRHIPGKGNLMKITCRIWEIADKFHRVRVDDVRNSVYLNDAAGNVIAILQRVGDSDTGEIFRLRDDLLPAGWLPRQEEKTMNKYQQAYEKAERKAISAHSTAVAMCNERAWVIADRAGKAAEQAYQTWMEHKDELYLGAHADAQALAALAITLDNGNAFAAQVCRKVAKLILAGDGMHLDSRYAELQRLPLSYPETAKVIDGLALMQRHKRNPKLCGDCRSATQTVWWDVGTCSACGKERTSLWGAPTLPDDFNPQPDDAPGLSQE